MSAFRLLNKYPEAGQLGEGQGSPGYKACPWEGGQAEAGLIRWPVGEDRIRPGEGHPQADGLAHPWPPRKAHGGGLPVTSLIDLT